MNENEVRRQLHNMVAFIKQEADEKASEILAKAREDYAIEKARIVQAGKRRIAKDFDAKEKQVEVQRKIAYSNELNQTRLSVLKAREEAVQKILGRALERLADVGSGPGYKPLLEQLLAQGLAKIGESDVTVVCRAADRALVQDVLPRAVAAARQASGNDALSATLTDKFSLAPARQAGSPNADACSGGVLLSALGGKILCNQTLDARLSLAYRKQLPVIRELLFGANENRKFLD